MSAAVVDDLSHAIEIIPDRLYWVTLHTPSLPRNTAKSQYFSIDKVLMYEAFFLDFGPLNLACTYRYCRLIEQMLHDPKLHGRRIVHCVSSCPKARTNAAYLMGAYKVIVQRRTAQEAFEPFRQIYPPLLNFRDASTSKIDPFGLNVFDCLEGLEVSIRTKLFDWERFNVDSYDFFEKVENGDLNWILPDRFLAFAGPYPNPNDEDGYPAFMPEDYAPIFLDAGIRLVIRLNRKLYDRRRFIDNGIKHVDLYFPDGTCPSAEIISKFLRIAESETGPCAVHCKAGLGRTGTLIGLYAMKHLRFPARAFIGWNRICRPGSILGPQQQFLVDMEGVMFQAGDMMRSNASLDYGLTQKMSRLALLNPDEQAEDVGQGEHLCHAKRAYGVHHGGRAVAAGGGWASGGGRAD